MSEFRLTLHISIGSRRKGRRAEGLGVWFDGAAVAALYGSLVGLIGSRQQPCPIGVWGGLLRKMGVYGLLGLEVG